MVDTNNGPRRPNATGAPNRSPFRRGSLLAQLENDRFNDAECVPDGPRDPVNAAWGRGWNAAAQHAIDLVRIDLDHRAVANAPTVESARELDLRLKHALIAGDCPSGIGEVWSIASNGGAS